MHVKYKYLKQFSHAPLNFCMYCAYMYSTDYMYMTIIYYTCTYFKYPCK